VALNAIGAYGFLAKAHIASAVAGETAVAGRAAEIEGRRFRTTTLAMPPWTLFLGPWMPDSGARLAGTI
jgi:hypothetical protein